MSNEIYQCQCPHCQQEDAHPDQLLHRQINLLMSNLNEQHRCLYVRVNEMVAAPTPPVTCLTKATEMTLTAIAILARSKSTNKGSYGGISIRITSLTNS